MIKNYSERAFYDVYQKDTNSKLRKIVIIHDNFCFDLDKNGNRTNHGERFSNTEAFWSQFGPVIIKKTDRPLNGFEPIVWGIYWTLHILGTIIVVIAVPEWEKLGYFVTSALVFAFTVKYRYNKVIVYLMAAIAIIFVIFLWKYKPNKK